MCGITGFWQLNKFSPKTAKTIAKKMADKIQHRGPDDSGVWIDEKVGIALAHRRLSILDLSAFGHQPMVSPSGRYVIVFNGEIYNYLEIRKLLKSDYLWNGHSDTETLLVAFEEWGIEETLKKTVGMFAIALWDKEEQTLTLARDRIGEKPLYYGFQNNTFMFASELKALKAHPDFIGEIDRDVICLYLRHCYIPAPYSIYKGIKKLLPGTYITFTRETLSFRRGCSEGAGEAEVEAIPYWTLSDTVQKGITHPFFGSETEAITALEDKLKQSIGLQMLSDVPLGAFLSGGVDSSLIVALMQAQSSRPVKTFSIGFNESGYDEAIHAKAVANHLGTDHTEHYVSWTEAMDVIPKLAIMYDEPFADSSQIPTFLVSQIARKHVTVSLSGDAGDELFCGYNRYIMADKWKSIEKFPFVIRRLLGQMLKTVSPSKWDKLFHSINKIKQFPSNMGEKMEKVSDLLINANSSADLYYHVVSKISCPNNFVVGAKEINTWLTDVGLTSVFKNDKLHMMFMDAMTYLPDDILVKVDRAAMANSLETRVPFLDHRVIELAYKLPMSMKLHKGQTKWILRQILYKHIPKELIERPKAGFAIPVGDWLRGPLRQWAESLLNEARIKEEGYFDSNYIQSKWQEHLSGKRNNTSFLWSVLMFQSWLENEDK
ncbi:MAG: asparagine synthase (glutamine-hydrolyzing) [Candidatus Margulisbacteria bacterium GWF2_35_9]|nr:MAG: asparagine synthase (glutamine-hydrolyzing) [Candidatus Margulisbacteria bacterium GWF2_35_9]